MTSERIKRRQSPNMGSRLVVCGSEVPLQRRSPNMGPRLRQLRIVRGVTLTETVIAILVFSLLAVVLGNLHRASLRAFALTSWKQQKTQQAQAFWHHLKKPLEEATDKLDFDLDPPYLLSTSTRPLKYASSSEVNEGNLMAWQVDRISVDSNMVPNIVAQPIYRLVKKGAEVFLSGPDVASATISDVETLEIKTLNVCQKQDSTFSEYITDDPLPSDPVVGTILEMSIIFRPDPSRGLPEIKQVQTAKFRINIAAEHTLDPDYH